MPSNHKVYQKKTEVKRKNALMKFFFRPLCAISLNISRLKSSLFGLRTKSFSGTDGLFLKAGVLLHARFFSFKSLDRIVQRWRPTRAVQRGSRQVGDRGINARPPVLPVSQYRQWPDLQNGRLVEPREPSPERNLSHCRFF